jgi:hypothetical protein
MVFNSTGHGCTVPGHILRCNKFLWRKNADFRLPHDAKAKRIPFAFCAMLNAVLADRRRWFVRPGVAASTRPIRRIPE